MTGFIQDIRYALRALARAPGFAAVSIVTLALGIGATTIVYSIVDGILLRPLPIADPDRVMLAREINRRARDMSLVVAELPRLEGARRPRSNSSRRWRGLTANLTGIDRPRRSQLRHVTWNLFAVLGVQPDARPRLHARPTTSRGRRGRRSSAMASGSASSAATPRDRPPDHARRSAGHRHRRAAADLHRRAGGRRVPAVRHLHRCPTVDVLQAAAIISGSRRSAACKPAATRRNGQRRDRGDRAAARTGVSEHQQRQQRDVRPLFEVLVSTARPMLFVLLGAVIAMLLIACVNLANLMLARAAGRAQEMAVRRSLGAARWRIARQMLTESLLLAVAGGIAGVALAFMRASSASSRCCRRISRAFTSSRSICACSRSPRPSRSAPACCSD